MKNSNTIIKYLSLKNKHNISFDISEFDKPHKIQENFPEISSNQIQFMIENINSIKSLYSFSTEITSEDYTSIVKIDADNNSIYLIKNSLIAIKN